MKKTTVAKRWHWPGTCWGHVNTNMLLKTYPKGKKYEVLRLIAVSNIKIFLSRWRVDNVQLTLCGLTAGASGAVACQPRRLFLEWEVCMILFLIHRDTLLRTSTAHVLGNTPNFRMIFWTFWLLLFGLFDRYDRSDRSGIFDRSDKMIEGLAERNWAHLISYM